ncbi:LppP/LprE family lipoprotein [Alicyclobacillus fodiniaquatilis]|uniref:LppP/LprE family lipoprotein n=1 Tax=Alicyclobacillus fodiniaquatilis TaxID=1661150 RepID=A0ABW4JLY2_9BACL
MNKHFSLIPLIGIVLLTVAGCATSLNGNGANNNQVTNSTSNATDANAVSNSTTPTSNTASNTGNTVKSASVANRTASQSNYTSEIALIKGKGYSVNGTTPNAMVKTSSGATLSAWMGVSGTDGYNQFIFFFLNGKYLGTDTAKPSVEITSVKAAENGIAVTYPVYKKNDSFANPTGAPVTITYTWNGSKVVPNKPYPKQFQSSNNSSNNQLSASLAAKMKNVAGISDPAAFVQGFNQLKTDVAQGNKAGVAAFGAYPMNVNTDGKKQSIANAQAFVQNYDAIMTRKVKSAITAQQINQLFVNDEGVMVGNGEVWLTQHDSSKCSIYAINP